MTAVVREKGFWCLFAVYPVVSIQTLASAPFVLQSALCQGLAIAGVC